MDKVKARQKEHFNSVDFTLSKWPLKKAVRRQTI
jgi:hypothetical protein